MRRKRPFYGFFRLICLFSGLAIDPAGAEAVRVFVHPVALQADNPGRVKVGRLVYRGGIELRSRHERFGGISGLHVSADGRRLVAVSDVGRWITGRLTYDKRGQLTGLERVRMDRLLRPGGGRLRWRERDAEALALLPGGRFAVGFEGKPRIWVYPRSRTPFAAPPRAIQVPKGLSFASGNAGLEALTALSRGRLFALAEDLAANGGADVGTHAGWIQNGRGWTALAYDRRSVWRPTGAATFPAGTRHAGDVLVVERALFLFAGFQTRIMHLPLADVRPGKTMKPVELATLAGPMTVDNFEGIAARRGPKGETLIYIVSDDNFRAGQRTLLMMFALP
ncbi:MAG TPA: esterase-like activity of phytase family protein [Alphaproteobacteria bacterium]|nr:esterase-like activity of phytase family protein [Alphaproteobacteria bacterium]